MIAPAHRPSRAAWVRLRVTLPVGLLLVVAGFVRVRPWVRLRAVGP